MSFQIKKEPKKPVRKKNVEDHLGYWYDNIIPISDCMEQVSALVTKQYSLFFKHAGISIEDYKSLHFKKQGGYQGGYRDEPDDIAIIGVRDESDTELNIRMESYEKRLAKYKDWYKVNKTKVKTTLKQRKIDAVTKLTDEKDKTIKELEAKLKKLKTP